MVIEDLLRLLNEHKVDFVIIGATGRVKDLEDLKYLTKIREQIKNKNDTIQNV